jgi:penicillin-binding protein 1C
LSLGFLIIAFVFYKSLPDPLFNDPLSTLVVSAEGEWLAAKIADDGQWRFPPGEKVPEKFKTCLLAFEDKYFYRHPGVNPVSTLRALAKNIRQKRVVNGGSTITMQVIRLSRKGKRRSYVEKLIESWMALRLEFSYSKEEILELYAANAPFGGNVVGIEAASRRYFNRPPGRLSWAEAACLAVLPNAPSLMFPGRNQQALLNKRNRLLTNLYKQGRLSRTEYELALEEPLPQKPESLPSSGLHLMEKLISVHGKGRFYKTPVSQRLQMEVIEILNNYRLLWEANGVYNAAVMVTDARTGNVLAYAGNIPEDHLNHGRSNNMLNTPRSSGSVLKPFLYAGLLQEGRICPQSLQADVPTRLGGYSPRNYDLQYSGAVPADMALARSLNVPAVRMLQQFGVGKFHLLLRNLGMSTLNKPASHYGLSLVLGGAEITAEDLSLMYLRLIRTFDKQLNQSAGSLHFCEEDAGNRMNATNLPAASVVYQTFEAMSRVNRPDAQAGWQEFLSSRKIAWKTGTSFGHRDAWALGLSPETIVTVWVGNAAGDGKQILSGLNAAAPVLFDVLALLPVNSWFKAPGETEVSAEICRESGDRAGPYCDNKLLQEIPLSCIQSPLCRFHKTIFIENSSGLRAESTCAQMEDLSAQNYFVLPPLMEHFYRLRHPEFKVLPTWKEGCSEAAEEAVMQFIYPQGNTAIQLPVDFSGKHVQLVCKLAHRRPEKKVFWYVDQKFLGYTRDIHEIGLNPDAGSHTLFVTDEDGNRLQRNFSIALN